MTKEELKEIMTLFMKEHDDVDDEEVFHVVRQARKQAIVENLPKYEPVLVDDRIEIATEFTEERSPVEFKEMKDEATI
ncbi:TPA: hypothetical protein ACWWCX_002375 [Enterococcus faecium]